MLWPYLFSPLGARQPVTDEAMGCATLSRAGRGVKWWKVHPL